MVPVHSLGVVCFRHTVLYRCVPSIVYIIRLLFKVASISVIHLLLIKQAFSTTVGTNSSVVYTYACIVKLKQNNS